MWILMDHCALGSVADIMDINNKPIGEKGSPWIIKTALLGLGYLQGLGIVHRDVKGGNLLVTEKGDIKLADFGVSEKLEKTLGEIAGTPLWMAPEVAKRGEPYNHKADIWSLGITLIELVDGAPPLSELNAYRVMMAIQKNDPPTVQNPKDSSNVLLDFLSKCLVKDYHYRWDTESLLRHPFIVPAKRSDIKDLLEKTLKRREIHKRNQIPLIDHTDLESPRDIAPLPDPVQDHVDTFVPLEPTSGPLTGSMILHSSSALLPEPVPPEPIAVDLKPEALLSGKQEKNKLAWQQPGYTEESHTAEYSPLIGLEQSPRVTEGSPLLTAKPPPSHTVPPKIPVAVRDEEACPCCPCCSRCPSSCTIL